MFYNVVRREGGLPGEQGRARYCKFSKDKEQIGIVEKKDATCGGLILIMMLITSPSCALGASLHDLNDHFPGVSHIALTVHTHKFIKHFKERDNQKTYSCLIIWSTMANCYNGP